MARLKLELGRYRELIFGRVLEQDEKLRCDHRVVCKILYSSKTFSVESACVPSLVNGSLYVRGFDRSFDKQIFFLKLANEEDAKSIVDNIKAAVRAINAEPAESDGSESVHVEIVE